MRMWKKSELSHTTGENVEWCSYFGKHSGSFLDIPLNSFKSCSNLVPNKGGSTCIILFSITIFPFPLLFTHNPLLCSPPGMYHLTYYIIYLFHCDYCLPLPTGM